jgi:hypothetical protein
VASRRPTTQPLAASLTCAVVWAREVLQGVVNYPSINGMQGVSRGGSVARRGPGRRGGSSQVAGVPHVMRVAPDQDGKAILAAYTPCGPAAGWSTAVPGYGMPSLALAAPWSCCRRR